jgi:hypothetical protein
MAPWSILVLILCSIGIAKCVDMTLQRDASGADVVRSVLTRLNEINDVDRTTGLAGQQVLEQFIREMAYVETIDGTSYPQNSRDGGIWGVSRELFEQTRRYNLPDLYNAISLTYCVNWRDIQYSQLRSPLYSGLAVRIMLFHLYSVRQQLRTSASDQERAAFWVRHFGGTAASQWTNRIQQLRNTEGMCQ